MFDVRKGTVFPSVALAQDLVPDTEPSITRLCVMCKMGPVACIVGMVAAKVVCELPPVRNFEFGNRAGVLLVPAWWRLLGVLTAALVGWRLGKSVGGGRQRSWKIE